EKGLNKGGLLSHIAVFEVPSHPKLLFLTDAAINIKPTIDDKVNMIANMLEVTSSFGISKPLVAALCAVEKVNSKDMPETIEAAMLAKMCDRGQIKGCIVDGPLAFDNAVSEESAKIKKIGGPCAGRADVILAHDLLSANILYKSLIFMAKAKVAAIVGGASAPIVLTSRADSHEAKYLSIVLGLLSSVDRG
ncbi:MAG: phosphate butyryltransferase, partial [Oligoflexales bacterium]|nr:phosphate butyryltransferase [Oligoflexales bacterium]